MRTAMEKGMRHERNSNTRATATNLKQKPTNGPGWKAIGKREKPLVKALSHMKKLFS